MKGKVHDYFRRHWLDLVLGVVLPLVLALILLFPIISPSGLPFGGDETYYLPYGTPVIQIDSLLQSWMSGSGAYISTTIFGYTIPLYVLTNLLGQEPALKLYLTVVAALPGILTYIALVLLQKEFGYSSSKNWLLWRLGAGVGALFYFLAFTNPSILGLGNTNTWVYLTFPLSVVSYIKFVRHGSPWYLLLLGIFSIFGTVQPMWFLLMFLVVGVYLLFDLLKGHRVALLSRTVLVGLVVLAFNAYWLVPNVVASFTGAGGFYSSYTSSALISFDNLQYLSHWKLLDVFLVGEQEQYFFWWHPTNYSILNLIIPFFALFALIRWPKKETIYFSVLLLLGAFLTKGVWEPGGYLYYGLAQAIPSTFGAYLRNPTKFVPLVTFAYAFLISIGVVLLSKVVMAEQRFGFSRLKRSWMRAGVVGVLVVLMLSSVAYGTVVDLAGSSWSSYRSDTVPQSYADINQWLTSQNGSFKVTWLPSGGTYFWKPYGLTGFPDLASSQPSVSTNYYYPYPLNVTDRLGQVLSVAGVQYLVYHGDSTNPDNEAILDLLENQSDLELVSSYNFTSSAGDNLYVPLPNDSGNLRFRGSPFLYNDTAVLSVGNQSSFSVYYRVPVFLLVRGYRSQFSGNFTFSINGIAAGGSNLNYSLFTTKPDSQTSINATMGYANFTATVPSNYWGNAIDLYGTFYNGSTALTNPYYIGRISVVQRIVDAPMLVFRNRAFLGEVFALDWAANTSSINNTLAGTLPVSETAEILSYQQKSSVEWQITVNTTKPFTLCLTEPYDHLWTATVEGQKVTAHQVYGYANGFDINQIGLLTITLQYDLQDSYNAGIGISAFSIAAVIALSVYYYSVPWMKHRRSLRKL